MRGRFRAAARVLENSLRLQRPTNRASLIRSSRRRLHELRVTPKGGRAPHVRLFFLRKGRVLWATHGFTKQSNKLPRGEIERADRIAEEWQESQDS